MDLLTSKYPNISGYSFAFNNPISFADPTGLDGILPFGMLNRSMANFAAQSGYAMAIVPSVANNIATNFARVLPFLLKPINTLLPKPSFPVPVSPPVLLTPVLTAGLVMIPNSAGAGSSFSERGLYFNSSGSLVPFSKYASPPQNLVRAKINRSYGNLSDEEFWRYNYLQNRESEGVLTANERLELQDLDDKAFKKDGGDYSVYQRATGKDGDFDYIGSAIRGDLKNRYPKDYKNAENIVSKIPNRNIALGAEEAIMRLNGGSQKLNPNTGLKNINRAVQNKKSWRVNLGTRWLNKNYPNWQQQFKFTK